jgi:flagellar motor switch/type III secretory pathway protein FliN
MEPTTSARKGADSSAGSGRTTDSGETRAAESSSASGKAPLYHDVAEGIDLLPPYTRSLLKVQVPVRVTLAATKQPLQRILEMSPGAILQFNKACNEPLAMEVGEQTVAIGEAVKVGDKFGLWINSIALPEERFWVVSDSEKNRRAK